MNAPIAIRNITTKKWWLIGWSTGIVALIALTLGFYPAFRDDAADMNRMVEKLPEGVKSLIGMGSGVDPFSPVGYLSHEIFAIVLPAILMIAAIGLGAAVSGDEEHGLLEVVYSLPISRQRVIAERLGATTVLIASLAGVSGVTTVTMCIITDIEVGTWAVIWATTTAMALTLAIGSISIFVGGLIGRRGPAIAAATTTAIAGYLITSLADAGIGFFRDIRFLSVFSLYNVIDVLNEGRPRWSLLGLMVVAFCFTSAGVYGTVRRDLKSA